MREVNLYVTILAHSYSRDCELMHSDMLWPPDKQKYNTIHYIQLPLTIASAWIENKVGKNRDLKIFFFLNRIF